MKPAQDIGQKAARIEAIQARFAMRLRSRLDTSAGDLPPDIRERLRVARERAMDHARPAVVAQPQLAIAGWGGGLRGREDEGPRWWRLASALPVLVLVLGLGLIQYSDHVDRVDAAAEVDAALLSDDLPPEAYADPGFEAYLQSAGSQQ